MLRGRLGYDNLDSNDEIIIFYTVFNKVKPSYGMSNCNVQYELVSEGNQSVDMHIISYIGYMAGLCSVQAVYKYELGTSYPPGDTLLVLNIRLLMPGMVPTTTTFTAKNMVWKSI